MLTSLNYNRIFVQNILEHPFDFEWSTQGLGMMRVYLKKPELRLHIWDTSLKIPGVSPMHTHPWDFNSLVIAGVLRNVRFIRAGDTEHVEQLVTYGAKIFNEAVITCGENACTHGETQQVFLYPQTAETYYEKQDYYQQFTEIHYSMPEDGTVTLVERHVPVGNSPDKASVFWTGKGGWIDAAPRPSTKEEIESVTKRALLTWF